jgi:hypothetical protein
MKLPSQGSLNKPLTRPACSGHPLSINRRTEGNKTQINFPLSPLGEGAGGEGAAIRERNGHYATTPKQRRERSRGCRSMRHGACLQSSHGASRSKARRMMKHTSLIRLDDRARGAHCRRRAFGKVVMKWPVSQQAQGRPVSPGGSRNVVGPSAPRLPKGTMRTVSTFSL